MSARRAAGWLVGLALLELATRALVYGLAPSESARMTALSGGLGGPGFVAVLLVALGLGALGSVALVWLASFGVRERWELEETAAGIAAPRVALRPLLVRAGALTVAGSLVFAAVESIIHVRAGMGFHGLSCLVGPVHRNALPIVGGLSLLGSAALAAAGHVLAWMRRTVGRLAGARAAGLRQPVIALLVLLPAPRATVCHALAAPRGPPLFVA